jgi:hypothetical protein
MKVTGSGAGAPGPGADPAAEATRSDATTKAEDPGAASRAEGTGQAFAEKLAGAASQGAAAPGGVWMKEIAAEIDAGRLQPQAALDRVVDLVLARQLGEGAPPAMREQVRAALKDALENDPTLAEQLRALARGG